MSNSLFYSAKDMCVLLGVSRSTLERMNGRKEIPGHTKISGMSKYLKSHVHRWINEKTKAAS